MGQAGIEQSYDRYLRGSDGTAELTVNSLGQPTSPIAETKVPTPGNTLRLTIDVGLQRAAERALTYGINLARQNGQPFADGGAIVALDPHNGAVLALASNPTYEPSVYVNRDAAKLAPLLDPQGRRRRTTHPGIDRAIDGFYPPGSVWKPVTALAAMEEGILSPTETLAVHAELHLLPAAVQQLGSVRQPADGARPRRSPSRATPTSTASARKFYSLSASRGPDAPALGRPLRLRRRHGDRHRPRGRRARADARLALQGTTAARRARATSTASGSRATRCSSRSARATSR